MNLDDQELNKEVHPLILKHFPDLNDQQKEAIGKTDGPLLIIAGPGSGKTYVLVLRTLNILLNGLAKPDEIVLCTFTEKTAFELRDRLYNYAKKVGYEGSINEIKLGTVHGVSNDFILKNRHFTNLGNNYEVLDDLTQLLFIFDNFKKIVGEKDGEKYFDKWKTKWGTIKSVRNYFNKISEELINPEVLLKSEDKFVKDIAKSYKEYFKALLEYNKVDFSLIQKYFLDILNNNKIGNKIISKIKFVMVDEYQDTNYIQEQLLLKLVEKSNNICVVGDEDQSLYRFRGATVRNILEFNKNTDKLFGKKCQEVKLVINYRSHKEIIDRYNKYMYSWNWKTEDGTKFRFDKEIKENPEGKFPDYPAVFSIWGENKKDEASRFADAVHFLKESNVIEDYNQVALLLHSVRSEHSLHYTEALEEKGIHSFCPRQRGFFESEEIGYMVACFSVILGYYGKNRGEIKGYNLKRLVKYIDIQISGVGKKFQPPHPLSIEIQKVVKEIGTIDKRGTLDKRLADFFYQFISVEPFVTLIQNENRARNLAIFSQLLNVFQNYYHYTVLTSKNFNFLKLHFFNSFLRLLYSGGINEYEDPNIPFPKGYVQVMTIHQSKGLEFPVVVVGSLDKNLSSSKGIDKVLGPYYHREAFEPVEKITGFDRMRLHYVAFSRAEKILVLTTSKPPNKYFNPIWQGLDQWPHVQKDLLKSLFFRMKNRMTPKKSFSFTNDLSVYESCPRQYQFFREYNFTPSRSAEIFFGSLVHQTIEEIHRFVIDGKLKEMNEDKIKKIFEFNFKQLLNSGMRPIGKKQKELAFKQIMNYFNQNKKEMKKVIETEVDVSVEKENYILSGKIDLLMAKGNKLDILDFKSQKKPVEDKDLINTYHKQLCIYGHIIEKRYDKKPEKLIIYWTGEKKKKDAMMIFKYNPKLVTSAAKEFDEVVAKILNKEFNIIEIPEKKYCKECDLKKYCTNLRTLKGE